MFKWIRTGLWWWVLNVEDSCLARLNVGRIRLPVGHRTLEIVIHQVQVQRWIQSSIRITIMIHNYYERESILYIQFD